jgi:F0F1-type ATP synthase delta subunit
VSEAPHAAAAKPEEFILPSALIGHADLVHLLRELESLDNELESQKARKTGATGHYRMPSMSQMLSEFVELNKIDMANDHVRIDLKARLRKLKDHAPVMHMTFSTEADRESLEYLAAWIRRELHPQALISPGLQPSLIAGVYIRTPNHVHDFSVRAHMKDSRGIIVEALDAIGKAVQQ